MANTLLTIDDITREALVILHQEANFLGGVNRQYDDSFAQSGAKIGDSLRIRLPNEYRIRTGTTLNAQDTVEQSTTLQISNQYGVDLNFTSQDLTLDMDDFAERVIRPAVSVLVANIESLMYQDVYKEVYNLVDSDATAVSYLDVLTARERLVDALAPMDGRWCMTLAPKHNTTIVNELKGLFNSQREISDQYINGYMGTSGGFKFYENTHFVDHTTGSAVAGDTSYNINGVGQGSTAPVSTLTVDTGTTTFLAGDVITIAGVNRVHPETKQDTGQLQQFVVTADSGTSATSLAISPALNAVTTDGRQNVTAAPADNAAINKIGAGANELLTGSMGYHPDAFTFATADLVMPSGVDMASRQVLDGVSMRMVRQYDINNDQFPCRLDILPAWKAIRPQLAVRVHADG